ncbi:MAG: aminotransferase class III-fold pyridoxal phosphate-dependent enzyme, partial [Halioglobus sp.]|nr:aminotransferase class III-fold pyridoxal phosphate-dependent enzyme [Halioglobus sp.]
HGNTLGALSLSGNPGRRKLFGPLLKDWPKIEPCYAYRHQRDEESEDQYGGRAASALQDAIDEHGAENIAAFVAETVVGATLGVVPPAGRYLQQVRDICERNNILLILDEVMAGCGRCARHFAYEHDGVRPDIVTLAKGLGGGYQPIAATIARGFIHERIVSAHGAFAHGHTYVGHPVACAAAVAVAGVIERDGLLENAAQMGELLRRELRSAFASHPWVGDIRGRGMFVGIELVVDRKRKTPPHGALGLHVKLRRRAMSQGLICYPGGGSADGIDGAHIMLAPPLSYRQQHVDELVSKLVATLADIDTLQ